MHALSPVLGLIIWSLLVWVLLYARRIPAMSAAGIDPEEAKFPGTYSDRLPVKARAAADNYNHLMEQPTIFYALMFYLYLTGVTSVWMLYLGWAYVILRVLHSLVQVSAGKVVVRFGLFVLSTLCLFGLVAIAII
jgi:hypothetical protein